VAKAKKKKRKMKPGGGSHKGGQFERDMCTLFSKWWTEDERDDVFWRTSGSGARATTRGKRGKDTCDQHGDMTCIDPCGKPLIDAFCFEFKFYKTYDMLGVLQSVDANHDWMQFWAKCYDDAMSIARRPFLVTKRNRGAKLGWVTAATAIEFKMLGYAWEAEAAMVLRVTPRIVKVKRREVHLPRHVVVGFVLDRFLDAVDPRTLEEFYAGSAGHCEGAGVDAAATAGGDGAPDEAAGGSCREA
jgi:hypothetical protein